MVDKPDKINKIIVDTNSKNYLWIILSQSVEEKKFWHAEAHALRINLHVKNRGK